MSIVSVPNVNKDQLSLTKPTWHAASWRTCCKQVMVTWMLIVINLQPS